MTIEIKHLRTLQSLQQSGSLIRAAESLFTSQSALSHQLKELESRLHCTLFERKSQPIQFTQQGYLLLELAKHILPQVDTVESQLRQPVLTDKHSKIIGIECHACFHWLLPVIRHFNHSPSDYRVEILSESLFDGQQTLLQQDIAMLFSDHQPTNTDIGSEKIGEFEVVLLLDKNHRYVQKPFVSAEDLCSERLFTYPLEIEKLDIYSDLLRPAQCRPESIKQVDNTNTMIQMVAAGMGIAALPNWAVNSYLKQGLLTTVRLGPAGIQRSLYAHCLHENLALMQDFIEQVKQHFLQINQ